MAAPSCTLHPGLSAEAGLRSASMSWVNTTQRIPIPAVGRDVPADGSSVASY